MEQACKSETSDQFENAFHHLAQALKICKCSVWVDILENNLAHRSNEMQNDIIIIFYGAKQRLECNRLSFLARRLDKPVITYLSDYDEVDELVGLRMGANDVLHANMSVNILCERIMAVHRRHKAMHNRPRDVLSGQRELAPASYFVDVMRNEFWIEDQKFDLTIAEINIVEALLERRGGIVSREELVAKITSAPGKTIDKRSVDSHVKRIRQKIHSENKHIDLIHTVYGCGYKFALAPSVKLKTPSKTQNLS